MQNTRQPSKSDHDSAVVADPILVPIYAENAARLPTSATKQLKVVDFADKLLIIKSLSLNI